MKTQWLLRAIEVILALFGYRKKPELQGELDEIEEKVEKKRQAMSDALNAGFGEHYHVLRRQWLQLCKKRNRLRQRLKKD